MSGDKDKVVVRDTNSSWLGQHWELRHARPIVAEPTFGES
jgi:hypothetical protein